MRIKNLSKIKGLEEYDDYSITDMGDVISHKYGRYKILKPFNNGRGYLVIGLFNKGIGKKQTIHRLVALAFVDGYNKSLEVNHLDEDKTNNNYKNLKWVTAKQNVNHGTCQEKKAKAQSKPVAQLTLDGKLVKVWKSATQAERQNGFYRGGVSACACGKFKTFAGYKWEHVEKETNKGVNK